MLKILALIVLSISLNAIKIPIQEQMEFEIEKNKYTFFEFPFKIKIKRTPFYYNKIIKSKDFKNKNNIKIIKPELISEINGKKPNQSKDKKPNQSKGSNTKAKAISIKNSDNIIAVYPKKIGTTEIVVWGDGKPLLLKITVVKKEIDNPKERHYKFIDYSQKAKDAVKFESSAHERVLEQLLKKMYKSKTPKGYRLVKRKSSKSEDKIRFQLESEYIGKKYIGQVWSLKNISSVTKTIERANFLNFKVFLVALESNFIEPGFATKLFIIKGF